MKILIFYRFIIIYRLKIHNIYGIINENLPNIVGSMVCICRIYKGHKKMGTRVGNYFKI